MKLVVPTPNPGSTGRTKARRRSPRTWFRDLRVSRKLMVVILVHLLHASVLLVVATYSLKAVSASRAYVEGEGLWGKAEKESVIQLTAFAQSGDEAYYRAFLSELNVTLGDRAARMELDKPHPDMQVVRDGFVAGKLSPDDVPNLAWLYRNFGWEDHIASAVRIWRVADENISLLKVQAAALHDEVVSPTRSQTRVNELAAIVYTTDGRLTILEDEFSRVLGDGARFLATAATLSAIGFTVLFVGGALFISSTAARQVTRSLSQLKAAAERVSKGDLASRAAIEGRDEVASVGRAFDDMAEQLANKMQESSARAGALQESLERFQALAEGSPLGIFHTDAKGQVDYANQRWMQIAGCDYRDFDAIRRAVHPDDVDALRASWRESLAHGLELRSEFRYRHDDGSVVPCATRATPLHDASGKVIGFVGTVEDMTERKQAEAARERDINQAREIDRLEELNHFRTRFINTAAHELRTPLTPMRAEMYLLRKLRSANYDEKERHSLELLDRNLERLGLLVEDLLQVSRYQEGKLVLEPKPADIHQVTREAAESFIEAAAQRGITLTVTATGDGQGVFDAKRISQVAYNLLGNAVKFTLPKGRIVVGSSGLGDGLMLRVADTGIGVDADGLKRLFQPFSQVHDTHEVTQPGSGLGLYICKAIIDLHGGTITAASDGLGKGTTITVSMPRTSPAPPGPSQTG